MSTHGHAVSELHPVSAVKTLVGTEPEASQPARRRPRDACIVALPEHDPVLELSLARALLELVVNAHSCKMASPRHSEDLSSKAS